MPMIRISVVAYLAPLSWHNFAEIICWWYCSPHISSKSVQYSCEMPIVSVQDIATTGHIENVKACRGLDIV